MSRAIESYQARVNLAASYMVRDIRNSRTLDGCFEMYDGELVVAALVRRAMKNRRLWDAIASQWGGTFPQDWLDTASKYASLSVRQLPEAAAAVRAKREKEWDAELQRMQARQVEAAA